VSAGDLVATGMVEVLEQLATDAATGCLHVAGPDGTEALVYLRTGEVYAMTVPGRRPQLGARLVSAGALAPDSLYEAVQAQHTELQGWRLSELLVHLGYVDQDVVEAFVVEQLHDCCTDLLDWTSGSWRFRAGERTRDDVAPATSVADLLARVVERQLAWEQLAATVPDAQAVPTLSTGAVPNPELTLEPESFALLCHVDGRRTVAELGRECGFTDLEAARVVHALVESGLLTVAATSVDDEAVARNAVPTDAWEPSAWGPAAWEPSAWGPAAWDPAAWDPAAWDPAAWDPADATPTTGMEESLARVSQSLEEMIAAPAGVEPDAVEPDDAEISTSAGTAALPAGWLDGQLDDEQAIEVMRQERSRAMAAAELASAHAAELAAAHAEAPAEQEAPQAADVATGRLAAEQAVAEQAAADAAAAAQRASANERAAAETEAWTEYARMEQEYAARQAAAAAVQEAEQHAATEAPHQAAEAARLAEEGARREAEEQARRVAAEASRAEAEQGARRQAEQAARADAEEQAGRAAEERARRNAAEAARREAGEQARREAAAMLNEITQYTPTPRAKAAPPDDRTADRPATNDDRESPVVPPAQPPAVPQPAYRAGRFSGEREETDTASLLRELSSLGQEDRPRPATSPPAPRPAPRPAQLDRSGKRRKGMFGR
jgi:hypothetical protein